MSEIPAAPFSGTYRCVGAHLRQRAPGPEALHLSQRSVVWVQQESSIPGLIFLASPALAVCFMGCLTGGKYSKLAVLCRARSKYVLSKHMKVMQYCQDFY